ncbi:hypothetical protein E2C01_100777 [Portunus trituberculatus]|uniref:Uncharacterized protein n=1 Tax=Portunus trituberculatus TaxID=210409 RepID=A0A5B7KDW5_PORTR|nr:hypothetical protein [Portunus trituberculatus]
MMERFWRLRSRGEEEEEEEEEEEDVDKAAQLSQSPLRRLTLQGLAVCSVPILPSRPNQSRELPRLSEVVEPWNPPWSTAEKGRASPFPSPSQFLPLPLLLSRQSALLKTLLHLEPLTKIPFSWNPEGHGGDINITLRGITSPECAY